MKHLGSLIKNLSLTFLITWFGAGFLVIVQHYDPTMDTSAATKLILMFGLALAFYIGGKIIHELSE